MAAAATDQHGDVRRLVLDAAIAIIETDGAESLSMREVARRAGVSHQAPYHYFGDRSGIFAAISQEGFALLADAFRRVEHLEENGSKGGFITYLTFARQYSGHFRVMFRGDICGISTHEATGAAADDAFNELLKMVSRTIGTSTDTDEAMTFAIMLWSQAHGLATLVLDGPLERKLPPGADLESQIMNVINLASHMVSLEVDAKGLTPAQN